MANEERVNLRVDALELRDWRLVAGWQGETLSGWLRRLANEETRRRLESDGGTGAGGADDRPKAAWPVTTASSRAREELLRGRKGALGRPVRANGSGHDQDGKRSKRGTGHARRTDRGAAPAGAGNRRRTGRLQARATRERSERRAARYELEPGMGWRGGAAEDDPAARAADTAGVAGGAAAGLPATPGPAAVDGDPRPAGPATLRGPGGGRPDGGVAGHGDADARGPAGADPRRDPTQPEPLAGNHEARRGRVAVAAGAGGGRAAPVPTEGVGGYRRGRCAAHPGALPRMTDLTRCTWGCKLPDE